MAETLLFRHRDQAPGVDPHTYNLPARSIAKLDGADIILYSGLKLEGRTEELYQSRAGNAVVLEVASSVPSGDLIVSEGFEGHPDPHVWGDPRIWLKCIDAVVAALSEKFPNDRGTIEQNADAYRQELVELHHWATLRTSQIPEANRILITSHDAFNYFGQRFGFEVVGIQGLSTESEAGVRDIERLVDLLVEREIQAVFVESTVSERNINALIAGARARGHSVVIGGELYSDAMGDDGTYEGTYLGMIDRNVTAIARALGGEAPERGRLGRLAE